MKIIRTGIFLMFISLSMPFSFVQGQVGINTENPQSTLDVSASVNTSDIPAGIIAPRQTREQLIKNSSKYTIKQQGAIVYVSNTGGSSSAQTDKITQVGYYYFDGSQWQPFTDSSKSGSTDSWLTTGNDDISTKHGTNYLGTNIASDLVFKTNGTEQMTISSVGNVGIGTDTPSSKFHVKGTNNPIKVEGLSASQSTEDLPMVISPEGVVKTGAYPILNLVPDDVGSVNAIDGELQVAYEISAQMTKDFAFQSISSNGNIPQVIGNITNVIIDNQNSFNASSNTNMFEVKKDGIYMITMNLQVSTNGNVVIGIYSEPIAGGKGNWVARIDKTVDKMDNLTLMTAIPLATNRKYSFRVAGTTSGTIPWESSGSTGGGPVAFYSVKRLR